MMEGSPGEESDAALLTLSRLWIHECNRVYRDALSEKKEKVAYDKIMRAIVASSLETNVEYDCEEVFQRIGWAV